MNFLRRIYLLLLGLLLVIGVTLLLLSPQAVGGWVGSISELSPVVRLVITIVIDLFLLLLMYLQIRPDPGSKVNGLVMRGSGAITEVSVESARERILKAVSDVPDVVSAEASVKPVRGRADIEMQVAVFGHDVKLPGKQKEISRALHQVIDKQLGLQIAGQPRIHIRIQGAEPLPAPPAVVEPQTTFAPAVSVPKPDDSGPGLKPSGGLLGGFNRTSETVSGEKAPQPPDPLPTKMQSEPEEHTNPLSGLLGGWQREREAESPATSLSSQPVQQSESRVPLSSFLPESKPVVVVEENSVKSGTLTVDDESFTLDLDDELAKTSKTDVDIEESAADLNDTLNGDSSDPDDREK